MAHMKFFVDVHITVVERFYKMHEGDMVFLILKLSSFKCIAGITYTLTLTRSDWVITSSDR